MFTKITIIITMIYLIPASASAVPIIGSIGQKANFADSWPTIEYESGTTVAVGVHDQRPYIIDGEKSPTYTGTVRGVWGNPFDVNTQSDKHLSDDIASAVVSGLMRVGMQAVSVPISVSDDDKAAIGKLKKLGAQKIVLITLREWRSDTYRSDGFFIDAALRVHDGEGKELANSNTSHKNVGSGDGSVESIYDAAQSYLSMLLNDIKVKTVLSYKLTDKEKQLGIDKRPSIVAVAETGRDGRFIAYNNGTIIDTKSGLMWAAEDNRSDINWDDAKSYCQNYRWGGYNDWRMPTQEELASLYDNTKRYTATCGYFVFLTPLIRLTCTLVWAAETRGSEGANFDFNPGYKKWLPPSSTGERKWTVKTETFFSRALPVRSAQ
jgi:hypothetical protein